MQLPSTLRCLSLSSSFLFLHLCQSLNSLSLSAIHSSYCLANQCCPFLWGAQWDERLLVAPARYSWVHRHTVTLIVDSHYRSWTSKQVIWIVCWVWCWYIYKRFHQTSVSLEFFFYETKPQQCVVFQLGFGIDIGLSLQWSKQMGRYVD